MFQEALATALGLPDMGPPTYQPRFLASTWTTIQGHEDDMTYASATHLLEDVQLGALDRSEDDIIDTKPDAR